MPESPADEKSPAEKPPPEEPAESTQPEASEESAATPDASQRSPEILVVDDEDRIRSLVEKVLTDGGMTVHTAASGEEALGKISPSIGLMLADLNMPKMGGLEMIRAARERGWQGRVMIFTGYPSKDSIAEARDIGVVGYVTKPVDMNELVERIEEALGLTKSLVEARVPEHIRTAILDDQCSVPMFSAGGIRLSPETLDALLQATPELLTDKKIKARVSYWIVNDISKKAEVTAREPAVRGGHPLDKAGVKVLIRFSRDKYAGIAEEDGTLCETIEVERHPDLAEYLYQLAPVKASQFAGELRSNRLCAYVLSGYKDEDIKPVFAAIADAWRHHEVIYMRHTIALHEDKFLRDHTLATTFLAVLYARERLNLIAPNLGEKEKRVALAVVATCAALHDLGLIDGRAGVEFGTPSYLRMWHDHAAVGHKLIRKGAVYAAIKAVIRDHHKSIGGRLSCYDSFTRVIQLASDLDNLVRGESVLSGHTGPEYHREGIDLTEACRTLIQRARQGFYEEEDVDQMLISCNFATFVNYYRRVREIQERPCKGIILSPNDINPMTVLCRQGPREAQRYESEEYCIGCSRENTHSYHGSFYHRCLRGHAEIAELNERIKHLKNSLGEEDDAPADPETEEEDSDAGAGGEEASGAG